MPGHSTARRSGYGRRRKSALSAIARPSPPAGSGVALVSSTERHLRPACGVALPVVAWVVGAEPGYGLLLVAYPVDSYRSHSHSQGCVLQPLCGWRIRAQEAAEPASRLVRAVDADPGGATVRTHPDKGCVLQRVTGPERRNRPAFPLVRACVEPPAGIEPATPSLPWNHQEPLCGPPFSQVTRDHRGQSYRFSFGKGMRSLPGKR